MALRYYVLALAAFALAAPAVAQLKQGLGQALTEKETQAAILGIDMQGFSPSERFSWRECIQPNGETLYETPAGVIKGKVLVSPRGEACFSYEDSDYAAVNCFATFKSGDGLRFEGPGGSLFVTTKVIRNVKTCKPQDLVG
jgi:hypothetical protein